MGAQLSHMKIQGDKKRAATHDQDPPPPSHGNVVEVAADCTSLIRPLTAALAVRREAWARFSDAVDLFFQRECMTAAFILACTWGDLEEAQNIKRSHKLLHPKGSGVQELALQGALQHGHMHVAKWLMKTEVRIAYYPTGGPDYWRGYKATIRRLKLRGDRLAMLFADFDLYSDEVVTYLQTVTNATLREMLTHAASADERYSERRRKWIVGIGTAWCDCGLADWVKQYEFSPGVTLDYKAWKRQKGNNMANSWFWLWVANVQPKRKHASLTQ